MLNVVVVRRPRRQVVGDEEVAEDATEVADVHRDARQQLLLDLDAEVPVVGPLAPAR